jgi:hypothetical protein
MDGQQFQTLMYKLDSIHTALSAIGRAMRSEAPNYQRPLAAYAAFDWSSIDAVIIDSDSSGPTRVEYLGHIFTRRNGTGKFGQAIWFSRPQGKNEDGSNKYARLVTFKDYSEAEGLDSRLEDALDDTPPSPPSPPAKTSGNGNCRVPHNPPPPPSQPEPGTWPHVEAGSVTNTKIADLRAKLEENSKPTLGTVTSLVVLTGLYKNDSHAMQALESFDFPAGVEIIAGQRVSLEGALKVYDWLIQRKLDDTN